jgi:anti-sigma factor NepR-like protein
LASSRGPWSDQGMARVENTNGGNGSGEDDPEVGLAPHIQARIGAGLQAMYSELLRQPIPDKLLTLLAELEQKDIPSDESGGGNEG